MADVKISLTGNELIELRILLKRQAGQLDDVQTEAALRTAGYDSLLVSLPDQLQYIAKELLRKM